MKANYTLIRSSRKTVGLSVRSDGSLIVRAPYLCPKGTIDRFVAEQGAWIEKQRAKLKKMSERTEDAGVLTEADIKLLAEKMKAALPKKLEYYSSLLGVTYGRVTIRSQRSKWGSCSSSGNLNFNCLLMLAPEEVLDYVVVHELCHRLHPDHSKAFWAEVERVTPDYRTWKKWLRDNGGVLIRRMEAGL